MQTPSCLLESLDVKDHAVVHAWWDSLPNRDRSDLESLLDDRQDIPTFSLELLDEREPEYLDEDVNELYEFLVNHEHEPLGISMFENTIPLPAIALLAPLWPPYPAAVRTVAWSPTHSLHSQLQAELDRFNRRSGQ